MSKRFTLIFWTLFFVILFALHFNHVLNSDEGVVLEGAWNLLNGRALYFEFFEFIPPASFYFVFLVWKILPVHYYSANIASFILLFSSLIAVYLSSRLIKKSALNILVPLTLGALSLFWPLINHNTFNFVMLVWAGYFFLLFLAKHKNYYLTFSALFSCAALLFLQTKGLAIIFGISVFLLFFMREKNIIVLLKNIALFISFSLLPITLLLFKWPAELLYKNLIEFVIFHCADINRLPLFLFAAVLLLWACVVCLLRKNNDAKIRFLFLLQFVLLLTTIARADYYHISLTVFPLFIILPQIIEKIRSENKQHYQIIKTLLLFALICLSLIPSAMTVINTPPFSSIKSNSEIWLYLQENCPGQQDLYAGPFIPGLYFESGKLNPTSFGWLITNHQTDDQFRQAESELKEKQPRCAVLHYQMVKKFKYDKNNPVDQFIVENYESDKRIGLFELYQLKND